MHEIYAEKFIGRAPAWHRLGQVAKDPISASAGYIQIGGYQVEMLDLQTTCGIATGKKGIYRVDEGRPTKLFAVVDDTYQIVPPDQFPAIWDNATHTPVETMFVLRDGQFFGITSKLDTIDIGGDEVDRYLLALNTFDGGSANKVIITPVRCVCMNTLVLGMQESELELKVYHRHNGDLTSEFYHAIQSVYDEAVTKAQAIEEAMNILAGARLEEEVAEEIVDKVYTLPKQPRHRRWTLGTQAHQDRIYRFENDVESQKAARSRTMELYAGSATITPATDGTAWGVYNAVVEFEDYVRDGKNDASVAEASLVGYRADNKNRAFRYCLEAAR